MQQALIGSFIFVMVLSILMVMIAVAFKFMRPQKTTRWVTILFLLYYVGLILDWGRIPDKFSFLRPEQLVNLTGGMTPWVLLLFLFFLMRRFIDQFLEMRAKAAQILQTGLSANLGDRCMHHLGNLMLPPRNTLTALSGILEDSEKFQELAHDKVVLELWRGRVRNAVDALNNAQTRLESFKTNVSEARMKKWHNLADLLNHACLHLEHEKGFENACSISHCDPAIELQVNAELFHEVLANLLENAVSAIRGQGKNADPFIRLSTMYDKSSGALEIRIMDNGPGIDPAIKKTIYEPYFSTKGSGSGIGLFLAKEFMANMDGMIGHISRVKEQPSGTTFVLVFPGHHVRM